MAEVAELEETKNNSEDFGFDFLVDDEDEIAVTITVIPAKNTSGKVRPVPIDLDSMKLRVFSVKDSMKRIKKELEEISERNNILDETKRIALEQAYQALQQTLQSFEAMLKAPRKEITAYFKVPDWETSCRITNESMVPNDQGDYTFSAEFNRKAKIKYLLKRWDLTDKNGNIIPVSDVNKVDGAIVEAFLNNFDNAISLPKVEIKN